MMDLLGSCTAEVKGHFRHLRMLRPTRNESARLRGSSQKAVEPRAASERPGSVALRRVGLVVGALGLAG